MKQILVFLFFVSSYFANGQQLLTPYNGTLSTAAQQILQNYQADITLSYIDLYKLDATSLYGNTVNVDFGGQSFQFFLDRKGEISMRKFWEGSSMFGDQLFAIFTGNNANITINTTGGAVYEINRLGNHIHGVFEKFELDIDGPDCDITIEDDTLSNPSDMGEAESGENAENNHTEVHCPVRIGMAITPLLLLNSTPNNIKIVINNRIRQSNRVYSNSKFLELFDGMSVELAFIQNFPDYNELENNNTEQKSSRHVLREFRKNSDGELDNIHISRNYYDADFCGIVTDDRTLPPPKAGDPKPSIGGRAAQLNANYDKAFFVSSKSRTFDNIALTFTHEIGHLFGCHHNFANSWFIVGGFYNGHGYKNNDEGWRTVMSYPWTSRVFVNQEWMTIGDCSCNRIEFHSNPILPSSKIKIFHSSHPSANATQTSKEALGTKSYSFCINKIAEEYSNHINHEVTAFDKLDIMIRTDGINGQTIPNMPSTLHFEEDIVYADLIAVNNITFSDVSRITANYERQIRAGSAVDINSNRDSNFEFDAQYGSLVDIRPVTIPGTPEECQPLTDNDKNGKIIGKDKTEKSNYINEKFLSVFPNPVKNNATIWYNLESNSTINLWITNSVGQTVKIIYQNLKLETGEYQYDLASNDFNSGFYFVHLTIDGKKITEQIVITK